MTAEKNTALVRHIAAQLNAIGISTRPDPEACGFLPGIALDQGGIRFRDDCLPCDLLHEAGHIAIIPESLRHHATGDLSNLWAAMAVIFETPLFESPDEPLPRACMQCSDPEATAWAFAFGRHCGIPDNTIIVEDADHYDGEGAFVRLCLATGGYVGINGLRAAGFLTHVREYPRLGKWLQNGI